MLSLWVNTNQRHFSTKEHKERLEPVLLYATLSALTFCALFPPSLFFGHIVYTCGQDVPHPYHLLQPHITHTSGAISAKYRSNSTTYVGKGEWLCRRNVGVPLQITADTQNPGGRSGYEPQHRAGAPVKLHPGRRQVFTRSGGKKRKHHKHGSHTCFCERVRAVRRDSSKVHEMKPSGRL